MLLPFLLVAGLIVIDGLARWLLLVEPPHKKEHDEQKKATMKDQLRMYTKLLRDLPIVVVTFCLFLGNGFIAMMEVTIPLYFGSVMGYSSLIVGFIYGGGNFVYLITMFFLSRRHPGRRKGMMIRVMYIKSRCFVIAWPSKY
jgi:hypothetical protein